MKHCAYFLEALHSFSKLVLILMLYDICVKNIFFQYDVLVFTTHTIGMNCNDNVYVATLWAHFNVDPKLEYIKLHN